MRCTNQNPYGSTVLMTQELYWYTFYSSGLWWYFDKIFPKQFFTR